jgi:CDGSH-type Zn-finger protein
MATTDEAARSAGKRIVIEMDGPYHVHGDVPLVRKTQVVSEHGEPLAWKNEGPIQTPPGKYDLCRCGGSAEKPFCDGSHCLNDFNGSETADTGPMDKHQMLFRGGTKIVVKKDSALCMDSGFCGLRNAGMAQLVLDSGDSRTRSLIIAMIERCPSGALTYSFEPGQPDNEPDLPQQIAFTTEITSDGPIEGPLWVTGGIPVERSDSQPFETRNRVTLCNCGLSRNKPLCDGTHRDEAQRAARMKRS